MTTNTELARAHGANIYHSDYSGPVVSITMSPAQLDAYTKALQSVQAVPDGMRLVPVELAQPMREILIDRFDWARRGASFLFADIWRDLLAAAPKVNLAGGVGQPLSAEQLHRLCASINGSVAMGWLSDSEADELKAMLIPPPRPDEASNPAVQKGDEHV